MDKLHGYALLVIAKKITPQTVWHYSTGNDDPVCGRKSSAEMVGYISTEQALTTKGVCYACAKYAGIHGDYQGWDSENGVRYLSITNPKPEAHCAAHNKGVSQCASQHSTDDGGFREIPAEVMHFGLNESACGRQTRRNTTYKPNVNCEDCVSTWEMPSDELWNAEDIPSGWEDGTHRSYSDYDAAMSWPTKFYRGLSEEKARRILASKLAEYGGFEYVVRAGKSHLYVEAAHAIVDGAAHVKLDGRIYRVRKGVPVNQTYRKGL